MLCVAFKQLGIAVPPVPVVLWRGCDICGLSQRMARHDGSHESSSVGFARHLHFWPSVLAMLPCSTAAVIIANRPKEKDSLQTKADCYNMQDVYLKQHFQGGHHTSADCILHPGESCPLLSDTPTGEEIACGSLRRFRMDYSGPQCLPWCGSGSRLGESDPSMESYHCYTALIRTERINLKFLENAPGFPFQRWQQDVCAPGSHCVISKTATFGPNDIGFPTLRLRLLGFQTEDTRFTWHGPDTLDVTEDLLGIFGGSPGMYATDFVGLSVDRESYYKGLARLRGIYSLPDGATFAALKIDDIVPVCYRRHLKEYRQLAAHSPHKMVLCDLATDPVARPGRAGMISPTSTKNTTLARVTADGVGDALLTPAEAEFLHGWPSLPSLYTSQEAKEFATCQPFPDDLKITDNKKKAFTGNGQHLACMARWFLYVVSHLSVAD